MSIRCASCSTENRDGARFCLQCGSQLGMPPTVDPLIGRLLLGRYRVLSAVGEGGMGRVYSAEQQMGTATRRVAIKVLHDKLSRDERVRQRFHRECAIVIKLNHPNTIQFYDFGELEDGRLFIVMEFIEGHSLTDEIAKGPMLPSRVDRIVAQIAGSLEEAHQEEIVHRDLKPDNILLTTRGGEPDFVKVCDFGIAKAVKEDKSSPGITMEGTIIGTPQYMSPEQLTGGAIDGRSDVYSLGLITFEMLTGQRPHHASTPLEWATWHTTGAPPSLDAYEATRYVDGRYKSAIARALHKRPDDRPAGARAFAQELLGSTITPASLAMPYVTPRSSPPAAHPIPSPPGSYPGYPAHSGSTPGRSSGVAPTMADPSIAGLPSPARPAGVRSMLLPTLFLMGTAVLAASGITVFLNRDKIPWLTQAAETPDAGAVIEDAGAADAGSDEPTVREWIRIVHFQRGIADAAYALGAPDQRYAIIRPSGTLVLELNAGTRIATGGTSGPDVWIAIDDERSGPYRADVAVAQNQYVTVGSELVGSLGLDADQFGMTRIRYVRIKNRGTTNLYLDAVGAYATARAED
ncbi:MAG: protein kinase [Sandaracinaceae bacterium]